MDSKRLRRVVSDPAEDPDRPADKAEGTLPKDTLDYVPSWMPEPVATMLEDLLRELRADPETTAAIGVWPGGVWTLIVATPNWGPSPTSTTWLH